MSPERTSRKRGRLRKDQQPAQPEAQAEQVVGAASPTEKTLYEATLKNSVDQITHRYMWSIYKEGGDPLVGLSTAQDELLTASGVLESFRALHSMAGLGLEEAQERGDQSLVEALINKQRVFSSVLRRLGEASQVSARGALQTPTSPSSLPPMTGRKG